MSPEFVGKNDQSQLETNSSGRLHRTKKVNNYPEDMVHMEDDPRHDKDHNDQGRRNDDDATPDAPIARLQPSSSKRVRTDSKADIKADADVVFIFIDRHGFSVVPKVVRCPLAKCPPFLAMAVRAAREQVEEGHAVYLLDLRTNEEMSSFVSSENAEEFEDFAMKVHKSTPVSMESHDASRLACMIMHVR